MDGDEEEVRGRVDKREAGAVGPPQWAYAEASFELGLLAQQLRPSSRVQTWAALMGSLRRAPADLAARPDWSKKLGTRRGIRNFQ